MDSVEEESNVTEDNLIITMEDDSVGTSLIEAVIRAHGEQFQQQQEDAFRDFDSCKLAALLEHNFSLPESLVKRREISVMWYDAK